MLVAFGIWLGAVFLPEYWQAGIQRQTLEATAGARERRMQLAAEGSPLVASE